MGRYVKATYELPYKGVTETRTISLFRDSNRDTKESFEEDLREQIMEENLVVTEFRSFTEQQWLKFTNQPA